MDSILRKVCEKEPYDIDDEWLKKITDEIKDYYKISGGRHSESEVSAFIYKSRKSDFEYVVENLTRISYYFNKTGLKEYAMNIKSLIDYITLELLREDHVQKVYETKVNDLVSKVMKKNLDKFNSDIKKNKEDTKKEYKRIEEHYKNMMAKQEKELSGINNTLVSILGIFSAIILSFFGGLSILGSVMQNINKVSRYRLSFSIVLIVFFIFNIIFTLLYVISKLTGKDISVKCNDNKCSHCTKDKDPTYMCLKSNFPAVFWYNYVCICFMGLLFIMFMVDQYNLISNIINIMGISSNSLNILEIGIIGLIIIFIIVFVLTKKFFKNDECYSTTSKKQTEMQIAATREERNNMKINRNIKSYKVKDDIVNIPRVYKHNKRK
ncbi:hypothetical protein [Clostridium oceanicum]|uniref:MFS transporter n=1 Tax=Clostridium oceanicum TaxID=1543 RepID=A0ABN1J838_9CLOT